ncbi:response regulator transcription factor [Dyadobacter psychrophilus]|uniref:DNA-binding response regulator, OmpR family, contains REC and winged-helix (WHTH) domain n=1 Tax=Dyadobacter psychrophilus TaxID=651661 RepID=A0A1T5GQA1_9BACT|nr:response regulator transcription factor [Dyadobacter psychrophilus]SKC10583.1 DNA-binding response regulator, OmpR family, contains REC and winged-helix (wHTH) domain [Dyadobacter psychrophilus]
MKKRILYVEDDPNLAFATKDNLEEYDYEVVHASDGVKALEYFGKDHFDICVLDIMLPKMDGFTLAEKIRNSDSQVPILFLTARALQEDKIKGLKLGADDYITKPFSIEELKLRIDVFLRRSKSEQPLVTKADSSKVGTYIFDFQKLTLAINGSSQNLTFREAEVLKYLAERPDQVIRRDELLKAIWGDDDYFMGRSLDVFISRLRKYLSADPDIKIDNIHGVGFRMRW